MLHPDQFEVNEAWIAFRLNRAPIKTEQDGDLNCIALMDAASCFILGMELIPATAAEPTQLEVRRLFKGAQHNRQQLPKMLFVSQGEISDQLSDEASAQNIELVCVPEDELLVFTSEACDGFTEYLEKGSR